MDYQRDSCGCRDACAYVCGEINPPSVTFNFQLLDAITRVGLAGGEFRLSGTDTVLTAVSGSNGHVSFPVTGMRNYTLEETEPPAGYASNTQTYQIWVDCNGCIYIDGVRRAAFAVFNRQISGSFSMLKADLITKAPIEGARFTLFSTSRPVVSAASDNTGRVAFEGLMPGIYELRELCAVQGYQRATDSFTVFVGTDGAVTINGVNADDFELYNIPQCRMAFIKRSQGLPLPGVTYALINNSETRLITSNAEGLVDFGTLYAGEYILRETEVPDGYTADTTTYTIEVSYCGEISVNGMDLRLFEPLNVRDPGFLLVKKDAISGERLTGAGFTLSRNGTEQSVLTNAQGTADFGGLTEGVYILRETLAPAGYLPDLTAHSIAVSATGEITFDGNPVTAEGITINDFKSTATVTIRYLNQNGAAIRPHDVITVNTGSYGPYTPPRIPGAQFVRSAGAPVSGIIAANENVTIVFVYYT